MPRNAVPFPRRPHDQSGERSPNTCANSPLPCRGRPSERLPAKPASECRQDWRGPPGVQDPPLPLSHLVHRRGCRDHRGRLINGPPPPDELTLRSVTSAGKQSGWRCVAHRDPELQRSPCTTTSIAIAIDSTGRVVGGTRRYVVRRSAPVPPNALRARHQAAAAVKVKATSSYVRCPGSRLAEAWRPPFTDTTTVAGRPRATLRTVGTAHQKKQAETSVAAVAAGTAACWPLHRVAPAMRSSRHGRQ